MVFKSNKIVPLLFFALFALLCVLVFSMPYVFPGSTSSFLYTCFVFFVVVTGYASVSLFYAKATVSKEYFELNYVFPKFRVKYSEVSQLIEDNQFPGRYIAIKKNSSKVPIMSINFVNSSKMIEELRNAIKDADN